MSAVPRPHHRPRRGPAAAGLVEPPLLRAVAELVQRAAPADDGATIVTLAADSAHALALGFWPVPPEADHPTDPLIGMLAPASWLALGLVASGTLHHGAEPEAVAATVLVDRAGGAASIIGSSDDPLVLDDPPEGWAADALARVLSRPTPPPADPPAHWLEAVWLDRLAVGLLGRPGARSWSWLADRHPLAGTGPVPTPQELARRTRAWDAEHPWAVLRAQASTTVAGLLGHLPVQLPPPASPIPVAEWFDDGSYARWLLRRLAPPEVLLPDLLAVLDHDHGAGLLAALTAVSTVLVVDGPP